MGTHAERVAIKAEVSRADQDQFALDSHQRAIAAIDAGRFADEIVPVPVQQGQGDGRFDTDEGPRRDSSLEALARLKPVFALPDPEPDRPPACPTAPSLPATRRASPTAPPRRSSPASAPWSASGLKPLARIVGYSQAEVAPKWLFLAPVKGVQKLLAKIEMPIEAFDLDRDKRGICRPGACGWPRTRLRLVEGERQRRSNRAGSPDRSKWRAHRRDAAARAAEERGDLWIGDSLPGRRRLSGDGLREGLIAV